MLAAILRLKRIGHYGCLSTGQAKRRPLTRIRSEVGINSFAGWDACKRGERKTRSQIDGTGRGYMNWGVPDLKIRGKLGMASTSTGFQAYVPKLTSRVSPGSSSLVAIWDYGSFWSTRPLLIEILGPHKTQSWVCGDTICGGGSRSWCLMDHRADGRGASPGNM